MKISRQSGFTIVEMLIVLAIIAMLMPSVYDLWRSNFIAFQQGLAADQMRQVNEAANAMSKGILKPCSPPRRLPPGLRSPSRI